MYLCVCVCVYFVNYPTDTTHAPKNSMILPCPSWENANARICHWDIEREEEAQQQRGNSLRCELTHFTAQLALPQNSILSGLNPCESVFISSTPFMIRDFYQIYGGIHFCPNLPSRQSLSIEVSLS